MKKLGVVVVSVGLMGVIMAGCQSYQKHDTASSSDVKNSSTSLSKKSVKEVNNQANKHSDNTENTDNFIKPIKPVSLTEEQCNQIENQFLNWVSPRAKMENLAVCDYYFDHGAAGNGNWYADTPNGRILVQDLEHNSSNNYVAKAIGGCLFYTSTKGTTGRSDEVDNSIMAESSPCIDGNKPYDKYLLANNGVVYELRNNSCSGGYNSLYGFGEEAIDDGNSPDIPQTGHWVISKDTAAQQELRKLLKPYQHPNNNVASSSPSSNSSSNHNVWTESSAQEFQEKMVRANLGKNSNFPSGDWVTQPQNSDDKWYASKNDGKYIEISSTTAGPIFTLTDNGNGTTTYTLCGSNYHFIVRNSDYWVISTN